MGCIKSMGRTASTEPMMEPSSALSASDASSWSAASTYNVGSKLIPSSWPLSAGRACRMLVRMVARLLAVDELAFRRPERR